MSETIQAIKIEKQIWDAKENSIMAKIETISPMIQVAEKVNALAHPIHFSIINILPNIVKSKEKILSLIRKDTSTPKDLHLEVGYVKELTDGVFIKKRPDGTLEIYVSEE